MVKKIVALVLILATSGAWFYLDYQNKQEIQAAEEMRRAMEQARMQAIARAKAAAEAKAKFEATITADLTACKEAAGKAHADFLEANKKPIPRKKGQFAVPKGAQEEADKTLETANATCQATYDSRLASGQ
jgi:type II secretory pathway pseudopilin PulG